MSIFSAVFVIYLLILFPVYFLIPKKIQWVVLLAANLVFYAYSGPIRLIYLLSCSFFTWFAALRIEANSKNLRVELSSTADKNEKAALRQACQKKKRSWIATALVPTLGIWIVLKYGHFLTGSAAVLLSRIGIPNSWEIPSYIVPLGMSFYTFDAIGYMVDIYRGKYPAEQNFFRYLTFVSFFAHIIQGPFSRFDVLGKTLFSEHAFSWDRLCQGCSRILWGCFKKLIVADKLALTVDEIFAHYDHYWGMHILFVIILYGIQIYADFSGYMDIFSGIAQILGIELEQNFRQPYFAVSVEEFWRRWHMTLGHWFRDYLFYPISMSKRMQKLSKTLRGRFGPRAGKLAVSFTAMFWVWSATGLWHGANWTFLIWGWLNMIVMMFSQAFEPWYARLRDRFRISTDNRIWNLFRMFRTFGLICFFRFFSRADSLNTALQMIRRIFSGFNRKLLLHPLDLFPNMRTEEVCAVLIGSVMLLVVDILCEKGSWEQVKEKTPFPIRNLVYIVMIFALILFAGSGGDVTANFIYANF